VALLPNNHDGTGTFGSPLALFLSAASVPAPFVSAVAVADMNLDGTPDVILSTNDGIHVLLNSKSNPGAFTDQGAVPLYSKSDNIVNASLIDIADMNLDGFPDVVAAMGGNICILAGDGTGHLGEPSQGFSSGPNSYQLKATDVNGDGSPDVLVSNTSGFSTVLNAQSATSGAPIAQFNEVSADFGSVNDGVTVSSSIILNNTGTAAPLITNIALTNATGNPFGYQISSCTGTTVLTLPLSISPEGPAPSLHRSRQIRPARSAASCSFTTTLPRATLRTPKRLPA
jgi:FG-GAP-like repeat